jgi:fatty-acyl-CoA synthase
VGFIGVGEWLGRRAELTPDRVGLVDEATGARLTYRALDLRARALAALLAGQYGIAPGDRVAILAANAPEYLDAFFAVALLGAILVPLNWRLTVTELATILNDCAPRLLLYDAGQAERAAQAAARVGGAPAGVTAANGAGAPAPLAARGGWRLWGRSRRIASGATSASALARATVNGARRVSHDVPALDATPLPPRLVALDAFPGPDAELAARAVAFTTSDGEEPALILYTSGTTGTPKGALLSHRMLTWNAINTQVSWGLCESDSTPTFAPFFHAGGLNVLTTPLYHCGGTVVLVRSSEPAAVLRTIAAERCTIVFAVPTVFQALLDHPDFAATDLSSVRFCVAGGSACPVPVIEGYARRGLVFRQGYGLTEVGVNCFSLAPEDALRKAGSVGRPVFHSRARVVDEQDRAVEVDTVGELALAGPHVCSGYWRQPAATAEAWHDGWWHTGDLVRRDADGYYFIVGRKKDLYISGGENIYPAEIEALLATHPAIAEAAVIAEPDTKWGEVGVAVVVPRTPGGLTAADVLAYCDGKLARYKLPRRVVFVAALPRNAMGKVVKAELRALTDRIRS